MKFQGARNQLLETFQKLGTTLAPGEEREVNLVVTLRRVNGELDVSNTTNEYAVPDLASLLTIKVTPAAHLIAAE